MSDLTNTKPDGGRYAGRDITVDQEVAVQRLPCDGVPRFKVRGTRSRNLYPYSLAYDGVFIASGCKVEKDGRRLLTQEGLQRLANLNRQYMARAGEFVKAKLEAESARLAKVIEVIERGAAEGPNV